MQLLRRRWPPAQLRALVLSRPGLSSLHARALSPTTSPRSWSIPSASNAAHQRAGDTSAPCGHQSPPCRGTRPTRPRPPSPDPAPRHTPEESRAARSQTAIGPTSRPRRPSGTHRCSERLAGHRRRLSARSAPAPRASRDSGACQSRERCIVDRQLRMQQPPGQCGRAARRSRGAFDHRYGPAASGQRIARRHCPPVRRRSRWPNAPPRTASEAHGDGHVQRGA